MGDKAPNYTKEGIWERVHPEPNSGCWIWLKALNQAGYGHMTVRNKQVGAHRISYMAFKGEIPHGLELDHLCRNPSCVNPDHLEPVTRKVNVRRGRAGEHRAAVESAKTHCPQGHEYTPENTRVRGTSRYCKACHRISYKKWRAKNADYVREYMKNWSARRKENSLVNF